MPNRCRLWMFIFLFALLFGICLSSAATLPGAETDAQVTTKAFLAADQDFRASRPLDAVPRQLLVRFRSNAAAAGKESVFDALAEEISFLPGASAKRGVQPQTLTARDSVFDNLALVKLKEG